MASEDKIREGARPFLEDGEEMLAGADAAGFELASPMALAITDRRLLSFSMGAQAGMGVGGGVKELVGQAPLADVGAIKVKRLLMGKVVELQVRGETFKLEAGAGANAKGVVEAFERRS